VERRVGASVLPDQLIGGERCGLDAEEVLHGLPERVVVGMPSGLVLGELDPEGLRYRGAEPDRLRIEG
jgi:hypothetical protein